MAAIPFGNGTEWIGKAWLKLQFSRMNRAFCDEIRTYEGTVQMYLAEKSQALIVPERVFFHLVDNPRDEKHPFAFLATYATKAGRGSVRHKPLSYALIRQRHRRT